MTDPSLPYMNADLSWCSAFSYRVPENLGFDAGQSEV